MIHLYQPRSGRHQGDLQLAQDVEFHGLIDGNVMVPPGKRLRLHGRIAGDLVVGKDGYAAIHGSVAGAVRNLGAQVTILGRAGGLRHESTATTTINDRDQNPPREPAGDEPPVPAAKARARARKTPP
jgi:hypothetical protein